MAASKQYIKAFDPRAWLLMQLPFDHPSVVSLSTALERARGSTNLWDHRVYQRRHRWAVEAPLGTFTGDFENATHLAEKLALQGLLEASREIVMLGAAYPFTPSHQIFYVEDRIFLREQAVASLASFMSGQGHVNAALMLALNLYHQALVARTVSVFPVKVKTVVPLEQRPLIDGHRARGLGWSAREDQTLHLFFSRQPDGKRIVLTDAHWKMVLEHPAFAGRRSKAGILQRINILNNKLKRSMMVDGYLRAEDVIKWQQQRLGQRNRVPRHRERIDGPYRGKRATPKQPPSSPSAPETPSADSATPAPSPAQTVVASSANPPT